MSVFHLAIPTHDLDQAVLFYGDILGARLARRYDDRVSFEFFGDQLVCHLAPAEIETKPRMYPRHFGVTFTDGEAFDACYGRCRDSGWPLYRDLFVRFSDLPERHRTFFIADPSNNLIEFKHYDEERFVY